MFFFSLFKNYLFIYLLTYVFYLFILAAPGLSCSMQALSLQHADFLVAACGLLVAACRLLVATCMRDLVPQQGIKPGPPALGARSLTHWTAREVPVFQLNKDNPEG